MQDEQIVDLYWARAEAAITETDKKYGRYCHYIAYCILENDEDAKEIVNDTYLRAWNTIPPHRPDPLKPYMGMLSRCLALDRYDRQHAQKRDGQFSLVLEELSECIPDGNSREDMGENLALREALGHFVSSLPDRVQRIFIRRYWYAAPISEIAQEYGMKYSSVTVLLLRTRKKLKQYLHKEGFEV